MDTTQTKRLDGFRPVPYARSRPFTVRCSYCNEEKDSAVLYANHKPNNFVCNSCLFLYHRVSDNVLRSLEIERDRDYF